MVPRGHQAAVRTLGREVAGHIGRTFTQDDFGSQRVTGPGAGSPGVESRTPVSQPKRLGRRCLAARLFKKRALPGFPWVDLVTEWRGGTRSCGQRTGWPPKATGGSVAELPSRLAAGHPQGMALTGA